MAETLSIDPLATKEEKYLALWPQIKALTDGESNLTANLANITAALKTTFGWWWIGFYWVAEGELVLGPFQGPVACTRIARGKGVCGTAWERKEAIVVADVETFEGHIACSSASRSEIVVPIIKNQEVVGVLDADSEHLSYFDETDRRYLLALTEYIASLS